MITAYTKDLETLLEQHQVSSGSAGEDDPTKLPPTPSYFEIATIKGVEGKMIHLVVQSENNPASVGGDSCSVNLKGQRLLNEKYGLVNTVIESSLVLSHLQTLSQ